MLRFGVLFLAVLASSVATARPVETPSPELVGPNRVCHAVVTVKNKKVTVGNIVCKVGPTETTRTRADRSRF